jgi:transcriptional regulator with XRE-family HTH domain
MRDGPVRLHPPHPAQPGGPGTGLAGRRLRDDAQLTQEKLVELMNAEQPKHRRISPAHLSRVESGIARISPEHLERIITLLNVGPEQAAKLEDLRRRTNQRGWWEDYSDVESEVMELLTELGEDATTMACCRPVPTPRW